MDGQRRLKFQEDIRHLQITFDKADCESDVKIQTISECKLISDADRIENENKKIAMICIVGQTFCKLQ